MLKQHFLPPCAFCLQKIHWCFTRLPFVLYLLSPWCFFVVWRDYWDVQLLHHIVQHPIIYSYNVSGEVAYTSCRLPSTGCGIRQVMSEFQVVKQGFTFFPRTHTHPGPHPHKKGSTPGKTWWLKDSSERCPENPGAGSSRVALVRNRGRRKWKIHLGHQIVGMWWGRDLLLQVAGRRRSKACRNLQA